MVKIKLQSEFSILTEWNNKFYKYFLFQWTDNTCRC